MPKLFYMNPTFQNPTGYTVPATQRKALVELAERYECILVEDEVYHDIYFGDPPPLPFLFRYRGLRHSYSKLQQIRCPWPADIGPGRTSGADEGNRTGQGALGQRYAPVDAKDLSALFLLQQAAGACGQASDCAGASKSEDGEPVGGYGLELEQPGRRFESMDTAAGNDQRGCVIAAMLGGIGSVCSWTDMRSAGSEGIVDQAQLLLSQRGSAGRGNTSPRRDIGPCEAGLAQHIGMILRMNRTAKRVFMRLADEEQSVPLKSLLSCHKNSPFSCYVKIA